MSADPLTSRPPQRAPAATTAADVPLPPSPTPPAHVPRLQRHCSATTTAMLTEMAAECVCPISQSLMVDPVIAADGHTYDHAQIEAWFRRSNPATSPQTREPLADRRLIPNLALRRTIEHLVESGRLDAEVCAEWQDCREQARRLAATAGRQRSEERFPVGSEVEIFVRLAPATPEGHEATEDPTVEVRVLEKRGNVGFFGASRDVMGRILFGAVPCCKVLSAAHPIPEHAEVREFLSMFGSSPLGAAPLPSAELVDLVFGKGLPVGATIDNQQDLSKVVAHIVRRLATVDGGLPPVVQEEWKVLDTELKTRRETRCVMNLINRLSNLTARLKAKVESIGHDGEFTLAFPDLPDDENGATRRIAVPGDFPFVALFGASDAPEEDASSEPGGGLFDGPSRPVGPAGLFGSAGLFGRTETRSTAAPSDPSGHSPVGGGLFGAELRALVAPFATAPGQLHAAPGAAAPQLYATAVGRTGWPPLLI